MAPVWLRAFEQTAALRLNARDRRIVFLTKSRAPNHGHSRRYLAATYAQLGQLDKARDEATEALRIEPWFTINQGIFARICKRPEDAEHFSKGLRKAGFPE